MCSSNFLGIAIHEPLGQNRTCVCGTQTNKNNSRQQGLIRVRPRGGYYIWKNRPFFSFWSGSEHQVLSVFKLPRDRHALSRERERTILARSLVLTRADSLHRITSIPMEKVKITPLHRPYPKTCPKHCGLRTSAPPTPFVPEA